MAGSDWSHKAVEVGKPQQVLFLFFSILGFELRALSLLARHSPTQAIPPVLQQGFSFEECSKQICILEIIVQISNTARCLLCTRLSTECFPRIAH
jgi:hypothetical protein